MKSISKFRGKILATLVAFSLVLSLTACGGNGNGDNGTTTTADPGSSNETSSPGDTSSDDTGVRPTERADVFDFGVIRFNSKEVTIDPLTANNLGSNPGGVGYDIIRIAGFQGIPTNNWVCEDDPDAEFTTIVSQNGEFWANVSRIEAYFYFDSENDEPIPTNVQRFAQTGGLIGFGGFDHMAAPNLLTEFDNEDGSEGGYTFGTDCVFKAVWDIDNFAEFFGSGVSGVHNPEGEYLFDSPGIDVNADDPDKDPEFVGGGVNQFGIIVQNEDIDNEMTFTFNWTGITIYVKDLELYNKHVAAVEEALGYSPSANTANRVVEV
jgi:hypothetical protein